MRRVCISSAEMRFFSATVICRSATESWFRTLPVCCPGTLTPIMIRTYSQDEVEYLAEYGTIPVINGLTDYAHPCQVLADLMAVYGRLKAAFTGGSSRLSETGITWLIP